MDAERRADYLRWPRPHDLRGANLRYALLTLLHGHGPCTTAELREQLESRGLRIGGSDPRRHRARLADLMGEAERRRSEGRGR